MQIIAFATTKVRGGKYFRDEMYRFAVCREKLGDTVDCIEIEHKKAKDIWWIVQTKLSGVQTDCIAIFAHGWWHRIGGAGVNIYDCSTLADRIMQTGARKVILYSCSCGRGKFEWPYGNQVKEYRGAGKVKPRDGVALRLGDELAIDGYPSQIVAHTCFGDTTRNPYACRVSSLGFNGVVRTPVVARVKENQYPKGAGRWARWRKALKETDLKYNFPFMGDVEIIDHLDKGDTNDKLYTGA